jgi:hypothetical protein
MAGGMAGGMRRSLSLTDLPAISARLLTPQSPRSFSLPDLPIGPKGPHIGNHLGGHAPFYVSKLHSFPLAAGAKHLRQRLRDWPYGSPSVPRESRLNSRLREPGRLGKEGLGKEGGRKRQSRRGGVFSKEDAKGDASDASSSPVDTGSEEDELLSLSEIEKAAATLQNLVRSGLAPSAET